LLVHGYTQRTICGEISSSQVILESSLTVGPGADSVEALLQVWRTDFITVQAEARSPSRRLV
jgi:hypothetical protein